MDAGRSERATGPTAGERVLVWDPLLRLFHWSLVAAFTIAFLAEEGESWHNGAGYVVLGLLAFRLAWGFVGPRYARFSDFMPTPRRVLGYLRGLLHGRPERHLGHNPAGAVMILFLLATLLVAAGSGALMVTDRFWGVEWVEELHEVASYAALVLVGIHVLGVAVSSLLHRENLVRAMITGRKPATAS